MNNKIIYFRGSLAEEGEKSIAEKYFKVVENRTLIKPGQLVIPRYSALPFYKELEEDVKIIGSSLINSYRQHCYVADIQNWFYDLIDVTPRTWFALDQIPENGPFVLKGATNSKKFQWNTHMFAKDRREAIDVYHRLSSDGYVGSQSIYVRKYVQLNNLATAPNGLPISEEYRFFVCDGQVISAGFYWSSYVQDLDRKYDPFTEVPSDFINDIVKRVSPHIRFWVFDVARTASGGWIVIELNDGQQSGLSENDPDHLYSKLNDILNDHDKDISTNTPQDH